MALAALGSSTQCRAATPPALPDPEVRPATLPRPATWKPIDRDDDGVAEADDACPNEAEDPDEIDDADGCPESDADKDDIADDVDVCPKEPGDEESRLGRGCPCLTVMLKPFDIIVSEEIRYGFEETLVPRTADALLLHLVEVLRGDPGLRLIVQGYCEAKEAATTCEARATKVVEALVMGGVRRDRLVAKGNGWAPAGREDVGSHGSADGQVRPRVAGSARHFVAAAAAGRWPCGGPDHRDGTRMGPGDEKCSRNWAFFARGFTRRAVTLDPGNQP